MTTVRINMTEQTIRALFIFVVLFITGIYSCFAQIAKYSPDGRTHDVKNTGDQVRVAEGLSQDARAIPLNSSINGPYDELKPALTPGGNRLYFSRSFHPHNTGGESDLEDIWYSEYNHSDETWSEPARMPGVLNNFGPNFIHSVSVTGDTIILGNQYTKKGRMRAGLSYSINYKGQWSAPAPIEIVNDYNISDHGNVYVSLKSGVIISAIQRAETFGGRDLYVSFWDGEKASEPINMGAILNSDLEESAPFLDTDNKTLYFASKGHHGYGGYDIYVTERLDDSWTNWSEPRNLGPAVNGVMDDEFFSITHCGKYAIFSRQVSVHNSDLFKISIQELKGQTPPAIREEKSQGTQTMLASL
jgi:hypothetical protein